MQLFDAYMPLVVFAALFRDTPELAGTPFDTVRADVNRLLDEAEAACADVPAEGRREALFAVCAFVDEALLTSAWTERAAWARQTLQRSRLGTVNAGVEFYDHVRRLIRAMDGAGAPPGPDAAAEGTATDLTHLLELGRPRNERADSPGQTDGAAPARGLPLPLATLPGTSASDIRQAAGGGSPQPWLEDALALYGGCMSMGFLGRYYDPDEREELWRTARASLERAVGGRVPAGERRLTPESYYMREAGGPRTGMPWRWRLPLVLAPLVLTALLFLAYDHVLDVYVSQWLAAFTGGKL